MKASRKQLDLEEREYVQQLADKLFDGTLANDKSVNSSGNAAQARALASKARKNAMNDALARAEREAEVKRLEQEMEDEARMKLIEEHAAESRERATADPNRRMRVQDAARKALKQVQQLSDFLSLHRVDPRLQTVGTMPEEDFPLTLDQEIQKRMLPHTHQVKPSAMFHSNLTMMDHLVETCISQNAPTLEALEDDERAIYDDLVRDVGDATILMRDCTCAARLDQSLKQAKQLAAMETRMECSALFAKLAAAAANTIRSMELLLLEKETYLDNLVTSNNMLVKRLDTVLSDFRTMEAETTKRLQELGEEKAAAVGGKATQAATTKAASLTAGGGGSGSGVTPRGSRAAPSNSVSMLGKHSIVMEQKEFLSREGRVLQRFYDLLQVRKEDDPSLKRDDWNSATRLVRMDAMSSPKSSTLPRSGSISFNNGDGPAGGGMGRRGSMRFDSQMSSPLRGAHRNLTSPKPGEEGALTLETVTMPAMLQEEFRLDAHMKDADKTNQAVWVKNMLRRIERHRNAMRNSQRLESAMMELHDIPESTKSVVARGMQTLKEEEVPGTPAWELKMAAMREAAARALRPVANVEVETREVVQTELAVKLEVKRSGMDIINGIPLDIVKKVESLIGSAKELMLSVDLARVETVQKLTENMSKHDAMAARSVCNALQTRLEKEVDDGLFNFRKSLVELRTVTQQAMLARVSGLSGASSSPTTKQQPSSGGSSFMPSSSGGPSSSGTAASTSGGAAHTTSLLSAAAGGTMGAVDLAPHMTILKDMAEKCQTLLQGKYELFPPSADGEEEGGATSRQPSAHSPDAMLDLIRNLDTALEVAVDVAKGVDRRNHKKRKSVLDAADAASAQETRSLIGGAVSLFSADFTELVDSVRSALTLSMAPLLLQEINSPPPTQFGEWEEVLAHLQQVTTWCKSLATSVTQARIQAKKDKEKHELEEQYRKAMERTAAIEREAAMMGPESPLGSSVNGKKALGRTNSNAAKSKRGKGGRQGSSSVSLGGSMMASNSVRSTDGVSPFQRTLSPDTDRNDLLGHSVAESVSASPSKRGAVTIRDTAVLLSDEDDIISAASSPHHVSRHETTKGGEGDSKPSSSHSVARRRSSSSSSALITKATEELIEQEEEESLRDNPLSEHVQLLASSVRDIMFRVSKAISKTQFSAARIPLSTMREALMLESEFADDVSTWSTAQLTGLVSRVIEWADVISDVIALPFEALPKVVPEAPKAVLSVFRKASSQQEVSPPTSTTPCEPHAEEEGTAAADPSPESALTPQPHDSTTEQSGAVETLPTVLIASPTMDTQQHEGEEEVGGSTEATTAQSAAPQDGGSSSAAIVIPTAAVSPPITPQRLLHQEGAALLSHQKLGVAQRRSTAPVVHFSHGGGITTATTTTAAAAAITTTTTTALSSLAAPIHRSDDGKPVVLVDGTGTPSSLLVPGEEAAAPAAGTPPPAVALPAVFEGRGPAPLLIPPSTAPTRSHPPPPLTATNVSPSLDAILPPPPSAGTSLFDSVPASAGGGGMESESGWFPSLRDGDEDDLAAIEREAKELQEAVKELYPELRQSADTPEIAATVVQHRRNAMKRRRAVRAMGTMQEMCHDLVDIFGLGEFLPQTALATLQGTAEGGDVSVAIAHVHQAMQQKRKSVALGDSGGGDNGGLWLRIQELEAMLDEADDTIAQLQDQLVSRGGGSAAFPPSAEGDTSAATPQTQAGNRRRSTMRSSIVAPPDEAGASTATPAATAGADTNNNNNRSMRSSSRAGSFSSLRALANVEVTKSLSPLEELAQIRKKNKGSRLLENDPAVSALIHACMKKLVEDLNPNEKVFLAYELIGDRVVSLHTSLLQLFSTQLFKRLRLYSPELRDPLEVHRESVAAATLEGKEPAVSVPSVVDVLKFDWNLIFQTLQLLREDSKSAQDKMRQTFMRIKTRVELNRTQKQLEKKRTKKAGNELAEYHASKEHAFLLRRAAQLKAQLEWQEAKRRYIQEHQRSLKVNFTRQLLMPSKIEFIFEEVERVPSPVLPRMEDGLEQGQQEEEQNAVPDASSLTTVPPEQAYLQQFQETMSTWYQRGQDVLPKRHRHLPSISRRALPTNVVEEPFPVKAVDLAVDRELQRRLRGPQHHHQRMGQQPFSSSSLTPFSSPIPSRDGTATATTILMNASSTLLLDHNTTSNASSPCMSLAPPSPTPTAYTTTARSTLGLAGTPPPFRQMSLGLLSSDSPPLLLHAGIALGRPLRTTTTMTQQGKPTTLLRK